MAEAPLRGRLLRATLSLPRPILRALSGGAGVWRQGRTLDARFQYLWRGWRRPVDPQSLTPEEARALWHGVSLAAHAPSGRGVTAETVLLHGEGGRLTARLHTSQARRRDTPLVVLLHGGLGVLGDLDSCQPLAELIAARMETAVLAVAYRLAPESRPTAALSDAASAVDWARLNAGRLGCDGLALAGEDFGAALALRTAQDSPGETRLCLLFSPWLELSDASGATTPFDDVWPLSRTTLQWARRCLMGPDGDAAALERVSSGDFAATPPAVIGAGGFDLLAPQAERLARRLQSAGAPFAYRRFDSLPHGFARFIGVSPEARAACLTTVALGLRLIGVERDG